MDCLWIDTTSTPVTFYVWYLNSSFDGEALNPKQPALFFTNLTSIWNIDHNFLLSLYWYYLIPHYLPCDKCSYKAYNPSKLIWECPLTYQKVSTWNVCQTKSFHVKCVPKVLHQRIIWKNTWIVNMKKVTNNFSSIQNVSTRRMNLSI